MSTHLKIVKDLVEKILAEEIDQNKERARASLDIQLNCQKRFVNMEHPDFKMNKELKEEKNGIRFKNHFGVWFQEDILNDSNGNAVATLALVQSKLDDALDLISKLEYYVDRLESLNQKQSEGSHETTKETIN